MGRQRRTGRVLNRGSAIILVLGVVMVVSLTLSGLVMYRQADVAMRRATVEFDRRNTELRSLEEISENVVRSAYERRGGNVAWSVNSVKTALSAALTAATNEAEIKYVSMSGTFPAAKQYPETGVSVASVIPASTWDVWDQGFSLKRILDCGPVVSYADSPVILNFSRKVGATTLNYQVTVSVWEVPITNWEFVGYGLPSIVGGVPTTVPATAQSRFPSSFWSNGGNALFPQQPDNLDATLKGKTQALNSKLVIEDIVRHDIAVAWNLYADLWKDNKVVQRYGDAAVEFGLDAYSAIPSALASVLKRDASTGVWKLVMNNSAPNGVVLKDYVGGSVIEISTNNSSAAKYIVIENRKTNAPTIIQTGATIGTRPVLFVATNAHFDLKEGVRHGWAVLGDRDTRIKGQTASIAGHVSQWGVLDEFAEFPIMEQSSAAWKLNMAVIAPRAIVVKATARIL